MKAFFIDGYGKDNGRIGHLPDPESGRAKGKVVIRV